MIDKIIVLVIIVIAIDIIIHYVRRERTKVCDGSCDKCDIRRVCDKDEKK